MQLLRTACTVGGWNVLKSVEKYDEKNIKVHENSS